MEAPVDDLEIEQGTDWSEIIDLLDCEGNQTDMTGWQFFFYGKKSPERSGPIAFTFTTSFVPGSANKEILVKLPAAVSDALPVGSTAKDPASKYWYDYDAIDTLGDKHRMKKGSIVFFRNIHPPLA